MSECWCIRLGLRHHASSEDEAYKEALRLESCSKALEGERDHIMSSQKHKCINVSVAKKSRELVLSDAYHGADLP